MRKENEAKKRKSINRKKNTGNNENFVNLKLFDINRKKKDHWKIMRKKKEEGKMPKRNERKKKKNER